MDIVALLKVRIIYFSPSIHTCSISAKMARIQLKRAVSIYQLYVHWAVKIEASLYGQPNLKDHSLWQPISLKEMYMIYRGMCVIRIIKGKERC